MRLKITHIILATVLSLNIGFAQSKDFQLMKSLEIYSSTLSELQHNYVDSFSVDYLIQSSIKGMTDIMDPYTEFLPEEGNSDFDFMTTGRYGGIGSLIQKDKEYIRIAGPYKGFPADRAGLVAGDLLLELDGKDLKNMSVGAVSNLLRGEDGTSFRLKVKKLRGSKIDSMVLTREPIRLSSVVYAGFLDTDIAYIRLTSFTAGCSDDFKKALTDLKSQKNLRGLIVDLRNNGGGSLSEAVKICNLFIPKGVTVVNMRGRNKAEDYAYKTSEDPLDTETPLAVLVNSGSASASEIVSGVIQDLDRGIIIGKRTFGKGLVQTVKPVGYNARIKFTTAKYYIPSGRCVQAHTFTKKNDDGSVAFIPDSLKKPFKTKNGRIVHDGGGVLPDIIKDSEEYSPITISLLSKNLIFEYSLEFYIKNLKIATPDKFVFTDKDYNNFMTFLSGKEYDYQTMSEKMLKQLETIIVQEKYQDEVKTEIENLKNKLKHDKSKDLKISRVELEQLLQEEIAERYYYDAGRVEVMLRKDKQTDEAVSLFKNMLKYNNLLKN